MKQARYITLILLSVMFCHFCSTPKQVAKRTITHYYSNIDFVPNQVQKKIFGNVEITVIPIDAQSLNKETYEAASRDGSYEKEFAMEIERKKTNTEGLSKDAKNMILSMERATKIVDILQNRGQIPAEVANELKRKIWRGDEYGKTGMEIPALSEVESYPDDYNPFKVDQNYLSVLKLVFENKGNELEKVSQKNFQIISGEEQLSPLKSEYFENNLKDNKEKVKNVYRLNVPDDLILTPNQKIVKYLAFPAINSEKKQLLVQCIQGKSVVNFEFALNAKITPKNYTFEPYVMYLRKTHDGTTEKYVFVVNYDDRRLFSVQNNLLWVSEDLKNIPFSIYGIGYDPSSKSVKFGKIQAKRFSDFTKHLISIDHETFKTK